MKVTKLGVSLKGANVLIANLNEEELEKLNAVISELSFEDGLSNEQIFSKIGEFVQSRGELELEVLKSLVVISRLSSSVGYDLVLATEDAVTKQVEEIKFNGIYIRRVSDGEIVYFIPYEFYRIIAKVLYSADKTSLSESAVKEIDDYKTELKEFFSKPEGSNIKTITREDSYGVGTLAYFHAIEGLLYHSLNCLGYTNSDIDEFRKSNINFSVRNYFDIWEGHTVDDFTVDEEGDNVDDVFELIYV